MIPSGIGLTLEHDAVRYETPESSLACRSNIQVCHTFLGTGLSAWNVSFAVVEFLPNHKVTCERPTWKVLGGFEVLHIFGPDFAGPALLMSETIVYRGDVSRAQTRLSLPIRILGCIFSCFDRWIYRTIHSE